MARPVEDERGASDFDALPWAIRNQPHRLAFFAFDLLHLDGADLRRRPLIERRAKLAGLIEPGCFEIRLSPIVARKKPTSNRATPHGAARSALHRSSFPARPPQRE